MKYLLLAYGDQSNWDTVDVNSPEFIATCKFYEDLAAELTATGELLGTEGLAHPALSRTVRRGDGGPVASEGPFAESKEVLASFAIIDCDSHDRAMAIAGRIVAAVGDTVEVRPIMAGPDELRPDDLHRGDLRPGS
ncbi:YciI family protein [Kribbella hippodromi]